MKIRILLTYLLIITFHYYSLAQSITNGSVTGTPASNSGIGHGNAPGWSGCSFSPDLCDVTMPSFLSTSQVTPSYSPDGGTWLGLASMSPIGATECASTTITGLTAGQSYTLYFCAACFGSGASICNSSPATPTVAVGSTSQLYTIPMAAGTWVPCSLPFTATASTMTLEAKHSSVFGAYYAYVGLDGFSLTTPCGILLPIKLLSFNAFRQDNYSVKINWQTTEEIDSDHFVIERSEDAINFYEIETVEAAGNSSTLLTYDFHDNNLPVNNGLKGGDFYYRLKQVNQNNDIYYSAIRVVSFTQGIADVFKVYPIPTSEVLNVDFLLQSGEKTPSYQVFNTVGQKVLKGEFDGATGYNTTQLNIENLSKGSYILELKTNNGSLQRKFVKG
ncbi:MAG: T9SS type A sorting domain-containing protein [Saprospiraceae bacterium]|nr:T9SS type A sorting domain-containing protein [Saprospiraceae bacterium]